MALQFWAAYKSDFKSSRNIVLEVQLRVTRLHRDGGNKCSEALKKLLGVILTMHCNFTMVAFLGLVNAIPLPESKPLDSFTLSVPISEVVSLQKPAMILSQEENMYILCSCKVKFILKNTLFCTCVSLFIHVQKLFSDSKENAHYCLLLITVHQTSSQGPSVLYQIPGNSNCSSSQAPCISVRSNML